MCQNYFMPIPKQDLAAALAAILTATIRSSLPLAPLFHSKAHSISSGKSYLCELITAFVTPQRGTPHAFPADDEECRKILLAELLTAPAVVEFDNLTTDLIPHKSLCTILTSEFISGRILGKSKTAEVGTRALFLSSGNNVDPVRDMTRRTITITLDPTCEIPATREFRKQPVRDVRANRGRYVSLALTIIRAWICAGRPKTECKTIATYYEWSGLCRQPLLWLGLPDPAVCIRAHAKVRRIDSPLVFPSDRNPQKPIDLRWHFEKALEAAEIADFHWHDLRHCSASYLAMNGASLAEIAEILGHKTLAMVKRSEGHVSNVVASMNQKIFGGV